MVNINVWPTMGQGAIKLSGEDSGAPHLIEDADDTMTRVIMPMRV